MQLRQSPTGPITVGTAPGQALVWNGTEWLPAAIPSVVDVPLTTAFVVDKGTAVPAPSQNGSFSTPFATFAQAVAAVNALAAPNGAAILLAPNDYSAEPAQHPTSLCLIASLQSLGFTNGGSVTLPAIDTTGAGTVSLDGVSLGALTGNAAVVARKSTFASINITGQLTAFDCVTPPIAGVGDLLWKGGTWTSTIIVTSSGTSVRIYDTFVLNPAIAHSVTFSGAAGVLELDSTSLYWWNGGQGHNPIGTIVNGTQQTDGAAAQAVLSVVVPALAAGVLGYADVSTVGSALEGISTRDTVVGNPSADLHAAGAGGGFVASYRVSAANTIRCAFVGVLAGGATNFNFAKV